MKRLREHRRLVLHLIDHATNAHNQICYLNVSSSRPKASIEHCLAHEADIAACKNLTHSGVLIMSETGGIQTSTLLPHYQKCASSAARGMVVLVHPATIITSCQFKLMHGVEFWNLVMSLTNDDKTQMHVLALYRSPTSAVTPFINNMSQINTYATPRITAIMGDFNLKAQQIGMSTLQEVISQANLRLSLNDSTANLGACIDHVIAQPHMNSVIYENYCFYHKALWLML